MTMEAPLVSVGAEPLARSPLRVAQIELLDTDPARGVQGRVRVGQLAVNGERAVGRVRGQPGQPRLRWPSRSVPRSAG